jgi:hypothetical protein
MEAISEVGTGSSYLEQNAREIIAICWKNVALSRGMKLRKRCSRQRRREGAAGFRQIQIEPR